MRAAHRLTDRFFAIVERGLQHLTVTLTPKSRDADGESVEGEFSNLLLDEELRERIAKETEAERALIMAHALSRQPLANLAAINQVAERR